MACNQDVFVDKKSASLNSKLEAIISDDGLPEELLDKKEIEKQLVRRINYTLLPFVCICVIMQFVDKATLGISAVLGIIRETGMTGSQYSWLGSFMYLGYIAAQLPNNYLMQKLPIAKYLGSVIVLWGLVMALTSLCNSFGQLVACRVLLGVFETVSYPCLLIVVNAVYRRSEQPFAYHALWFSNGIGVIISSLGAYGMSFLNDAHGIKTWKWPYIIWGIVTVAFGITVFFFFPDIPKSKWYRLSVEEEEIVDAKTRDNAIVRVKEFKWHHIFEALKEPRLYLLCVSSLCNSFQNAGLVSFSSIIVAGLGFTAKESILLQTVVGFFGAGFTFIGYFVAKKTRQLYFGILVCTTISLIGLVLLAALPNTGIKLLGYYLAYAFNGTQVVLLTVTGENITGYTKKIFYNGAILICYTLGNFIGPLVMLSREAPVYKTGIIIFCIANAVVLVSMLAVQQIMAKQNKERLRDHANEVFDVTNDLTDQENKSFIYRL